MFRSTVFSACIRYEQVQLHHSRQDGRGSLFEVSRDTHITNKTEGGLALHPSGNNKNPQYPVQRTMFGNDRKSYWKDRLNQMNGD